MSSQPCTRNSSIPHRDNLKLDSWEIGRDQFTCRWCTHERDVLSTVSHPISRVECFTAKHNWGIEPASSPTKPYHGLAGDATKAEVPLSLGFDHAEATGNFLVFLTSFQADFMA